LSFGVPAALKSAGFPEPLNCVIKLSMTELRNSSSLGNSFSSAIFQAFVLALFVHQCSHYARYWIAQRGVEYRP